MRNELSILAPAVALLACAPEPAGREYLYDDEGDGDGDFEDEHSDGDGQSHDGESDGGARGHGPDPICDMSEFLQVGIEWVDLTPSLIPGALPAVVDLDVTNSDIFAAGIHDTDNVRRQRGFIERRELDGTLVWLVEIADVRGVAATWDGVHLYGVLDDEVRRWTVDGLIDKWSVPASNFAAMAVGETAVAIAYTDEEYVPDSPDSFDSDTTHLALSKSLPLMKVSLGSWDAPDLDHRTQAIALAPWDRWIAAVASDGPDEGPLFLTEFGQPGIFARLDVDSQSHIVAMLSPVDALLVFGYARAQPAWIVGISSDGDQLWRKDHWLCHGADSALVEVIEHKGALWGLAWVRTNHNRPAYLLLRFGLTGQLVSAQAIPIDSEYYGLNALDVSAKQAYVGGWLSDGVNRERVIGRIEL